MRCAGKFGLDHRQEVGSELPEKRLHNLSFQLPLQLLSGLYLPTKH